MSVKLVTIANGRLFGGATSDAIILRRLNWESGSIEIALPFQEDTPNMFLSMSEALYLRDALDELVGVIPRLEPAKQVLFPETFISPSDQSALSGLLDKYPQDTEAHLTARKAIQQAINLLGLKTGGYEVL
jgi:hypothetical protein